MASVNYVSATRVFSKGAPPAVDALDLNVQDGEFTEPPWLSELAGKPGWDSDPGPRRRQPVP